MGNKKIGATSLNAVPIKIMKFLSFSELHHAAAHSGIRHRSRGILLLIADYAFGSQEHAGNRCRIFKSNTGNLSRIYDTLFTQIAILFSLSVEAEVSFALANLVNHNSALNAALEQI